MTVVFLMSTLYRNKLNNYRTRHFCSFDFYVSNIMAFHICSVFFILSLTALSFYRAFCCFFFLFSLSMRHLGVYLRAFTCVIMRCSGWLQSGRPFRSLSVIKSILFWELLTYYHIYFLSYYHIYMFLSKMFFVLSGFIH